MKRNYSLLTNRFGYLDATQYAEKDKYSSTAYSAITI